MTLYTVAGLSQKIDLPVPLIIDLIPTGQIKQRPGITRAQPGYWVQHETGNPSPGAGALMHSRYLHQGAPNASGQPQTLSYHFTCDDSVIYQMIPVNEVTWQAADGNGPGNMSGISCELCINQGIDTANSRHIAEALAGGVMKALRMTPDRIKRHWDFNAGSGDRHHCPDQIMNDNYWPTFVANTTKIINAGAGTTYAPRVPVPGDVKSKTVSGYPFVRGVGSLTLAEDTEPKQYADPTAKVTGKAYKAGRKITPQYITIGSDDELWVVEGGSKPGQRWPFSAFKEGQ